jgi:hypothetical protein
LASTKVSESVHELDRGDPFDRFELQLADSDDAAMWGAYGLACEF